MNKKRIMSLLVVFVFLFTAVPFNAPISAMASGNDAILQDGKIILADFGYSNKANIKKRSDNFAYTNEFTADGKDTSMKFTLTSQVKEMDVIPLLQRADWPLAGDLKFKMYNSGNYNNGFVLVICSLNGKDGWKPNSVNFCDLNPGWNEVSVPRTEIDKVINNSSANLSDSSNDIFIRINCGGWPGNYAYTPGDVIYIDSIYLDLPDYGSNLVAPVPGIENGAGHLESDLGGNNTYTLSFSEPIWHDLHMEDGNLYELKDAVEVYEYDSSSGEYVLTEQTYSVSANGNDIDIAFSSPLDTAAYKVAVISDVLISKKGKKLADDCEYFFSVNMDSALFVAVSSNPASGEVIEDISAGFEYIINFNNEIDPFDIEHMVSVSADGKAYDAYSVRNDGNLLIITFNEELPSDCNFVVTFSDELADLNGFFISGVREYSFRTPDVIGKYGVLFDASEPKMMNKVLDKSLNPVGNRISLEAETENILSGNNALKINHTAITSKDENILLSFKAVKDITDYKYINYNIYCPKATGEGVNLMLRTLEGHRNPSNKQWYRYILKTDWEGWKTVSLPVDSLVAEYGIGTYIDVALLNLGGWGQTKAESGYFFVDRIWMTNEQPVGAVLISAELENGASYVEANLGGDNAFSFEFDSELFEGNCSNSVRVEKYNGTGFDDYSDYETRVNGNKMDVYFGSDLIDGTTFKITLDSARVLSGSMATGECATFEYVFTVGSHTPFFKLESSSVESGDVVSELDSLELVFNNELEKTNYVPDFISLYCDGERVYNAFDSSIDGEKLTLEFIKDFKNGSEYDVVISPEYTDKFGNLYVGEEKISFVYGEKTEEKTTSVIFSAGEVTVSGNKKSFTQLGTPFAMNESELNFFPQNAKFSYKKSVAESATVNGYFVRGKSVPLEGMEYFNMLAYLPEVTGNSAWIIFYTNSASNKYETAYKLALDWQGWKLISISLSDLMNSGSKIDGILFNTGGWGATVPSDGYILFDAVWASANKPAPLALEASGFAGGDSEADVVGETLNLKFNASINTDTAPTLKLVDENGVETNDYDVSIAGNEISIRLGRLSSSTQYTLTVDNMVSNEFSNLKEPVVLTFATKSDGVFIKDIDFENKTATAELENISSNDTEVTFTAYAIGADNNLLEKISKKVTASKNNVTRISQSFTTNEEIADVKIFITDSSEKFVSRKYFSGKSGSVVITSQLPGSVALVSIDSYALNVNVFDVSFGLSSVSDAAVVEIANSDSDVVAANIVKTDANGKAEFYYVFPADMPDGSYTVTVKSDGKLASESFVYLSNDNRDELLKLVNGNSDKKLAEFLKENKDVFAIDDCTDEQIEDFASITIDNAPFNNFADTLKFVKSLPGILEKFNSATWSQLTVLIEKYTGLLGADSNSDIKYFCGLGEKNQNEISKLLAKKLPADTYAEFKQRLSDAIDNYEDTPTSNKSGGGGGGSRGGAMEVILPMIPDADSNPFVNPGTIFTDLSRTQWAIESIMSLYSANIISYPADGKFRPDDDITREEFVKMIVCAFGESAPVIEHHFTDEAEDAWYNEYLSKAYALGITKGYPDGSFGVGKKISREDMVTMCARTLELLGYNITSSGTLSFSDSADISEYAYAHINALADLGVINGMGDGSFAPKATATRAQSAKVIAMLMELF